MHMRMMYNVLINKVMHSLRQDVNRSMDRAGVGRGTGASYGLWMLDRVPVIMQKNGI